MCFLTPPTGLLMTTILFIGLSLFLCSAAAIYVTLRASSISDLRRKPMRRRKLFPLKAARARQNEGRPEMVALADRRGLDEEARSIEGAVFFF